MKGHKDNCFEGLAGSRQVDWTNGESQRKAKVHLLILSNIISQFAKIKNTLEEKFKEFLC